MASTAKYNFQLQQGATFERKFVWKGSNKRPINLTGWSALLQIRSAVGEAIICELTVANGGLTLGGTSGAITVSFSAALTSSLSFTTAVFDLLMIPPTGLGTKDRRLLEGKVTFSPAVTVPQ